MVVMQDIPVREERMPTLCISDLRLLHRNLEDHMSGDDDQSQSAVVLAVGNEINYEVIMHERIIRP